MSRAARPHSPVPRMAVKGALELGAALGISEDAARQVAHEIPGIRLGRTVIYSTSTVQAWLDANAERVLDGAS